MTTVRELEAKRNDFLLNHFTKEESLDYLKYLAKKYVETYGTIENNYQDESEDRIKINKVIKESIDVLSTKYTNIPEYEVANEVAELVVSFIELKYEYFFTKANTEYKFLKWLLAEMESSLIKMKFNLNGLGLDYYSRSLNRHTEMTISSNIQFIFKEFNNYKQIYETIEIKSIDYYEAEDPMKQNIEDKISKISSKIDKVIGDFNNLINNPFQEVVESECNIMKELWTSDEDRTVAIQRVKDKIPSYDFSKFKLIIPEGVNNDYT